MEFKGTKGEWYFESNGVDAFEIKSKGLNILNNDVDIDVQEANAKIMVASRDLLEALQALYSQVKATGLSLSYGMTKAEKAIEKALK